MKNTEPRWIGIAQQRPKKPKPFICILQPFWNRREKNPCCASFSKTSAADKLGLLKYFGEEEVDERRSRCSGWPLMWTLCCSGLWKCVHVLPGTYERLGVLQRLCFMYFQRSAVNRCALERVNLRWSKRRGAGKARGGGPNWAGERQPPHRPSFIPH